MVLCLPHYGLNALSLFRQRKESVRQAGDIVRAPILEASSQGRRHLKLFHPPGAMSVSAALLMLFALSACQPTVKVEAPDEPITINLNIKLDADIRLRLEEEAVDDIAANPDIF